MMELGCQSAQAADNQQQRWVLASVVMCFNEGKNFCRTGIVMGFNWSVLRRYAWLLPLLAFLCTATYWRSLSLPLISDDYLQIELGRKYGPISSWPDLANDALYRCRATSIVVTHWTEQMFGVNPLWFNLSSLLIHFGNCSLVILLGFWRPIGFARSVPAACIFAFLQRPHEAVIWYAALPELLVFTFTLAALVAWILHCNSRQWHWFALSMAAFLLALLSKESAVVFVPLALLVAVAEPKLWWRLTPAIALSVLYFLAIYGDRQTHLHFNDGTFSLSAPFWSAELRTIGRLLGFWGTAALLVLAAWHRSWKLIGLCVLWMVITLLPTKASPPAATPTWPPSVRPSCSVWRGSPSANASRGTRQFRSPSPPSASFSKPPTSQSTNTDNSCNAPGQPNGSSQPRLTIPAPYSYSASPTPSKSRQ